MKALDKRVKSLEQDCMNERRMRYLTQPRLDVGLAEALGELISMPPTEVSLYLQTLSDATLKALDDELSKHIGDPHEPQAPN